MKIRLHIVCVILLYLSSIAKLESADENKYYIGISAGSNYIINTTEKPYLMEEPQCGGFDLGTSQGINAALKVGLRLIPNVISIEGRLMYDSRPFESSGTSDCFEVLDPTTEQYVPFVRSHYYEGTFDYIVFDIGINVYPLSKVPVAVRLSFDAGNPLVKAKFTQRESVASPTSVRFSDGSQNRINEKGDFNNTSSSLGAGASLLYNMFLNQDLSIDFELGYRYGINSALSDFKHKSDIVRASAGVSYHFGRTKPEEPKLIEPIIDEVEIEAEPIAEIIQPKEKIILDAASNSITVSETIVTQTFPLLPYYFFEENSSRLYDKYISSKAASQFDEQNLDKETMNIYYNSLDIIGKRLSISDASLNIVGYTDGKERGTTEERKLLAKERAQTIAEYFVSKWSISPKRLIIESGDLPINRTNIDYEEAAEENRRVELFSTNPEILAPVLHRNFSEYKYSPDDLSFDMNLNRKTNLSYHIESGGKSYFSNKFQDIDLKNYHAKFNMNENTIHELITKSKSQAINLLIEAVSNDTTEKRVLPVKIRIETEKFEIGRLNLIVFDFDKSTMNNSNKVLVADFAKDAIKQNSVVSITGTTDKLGEADYNLNLSQRRADNTKQIISNVLPNTNFVEVIGIGSDNPKYDNNLPEGRFYNRTVLIEVKTPIDK